MQLQTLRELALPGSVLERPKPLLLLCYLALEGPKERRFLSELFWPTSEKSLASLSTTLYRINHEAPEAIQSDETRVWTQLKTDTQALLSAILQETFDPSLYTGAFLQGFYVADISEELDEWILQTRESLALKIQKTLLKQAEKMAALGQFAEAAERTEIVLKLPGAAELEPEDLLRCYPLMLATEHPLFTTLQKQLEDYGIKSNLSSHEARSRLRQVFVGRSREIETLSALSSGEWAWLKGGTGLGKTSLLQQLPGRYLSGQAGLPYATLEPLVGEAVQNGAEAVLRRLSRQEGLIKLDNWEQADSESQEVFKRLKSLKGDFKIVITSTQAPSFSIDKILELSPLSNQDLEDDLWKRTGGVPNLVSAYMRSEPLPQALASTLHHLSETARYLYLSLALLEEPDVGLVRRGLKLSAGDLAKALEELMGAGLAQVSGRVWPREVAREYLQNQPILRAHLALSLARQLQPKQAINLYQTAKDLWEEQDFEAVKEAYIHHAKGLLERGFPQRAVDLLGEAPKDEEITFWKAYALERCGNFSEALEFLKHIPETIQVKALKATLLFRLGNPITAQKLAKQALNGNLWARAQAHSTLADIAYHNQEFKSATDLGRRAVVLWQAQGNRSRAANSLNAIAVYLDNQGVPLEKVEAAYQEALELASDDTRLKAIILGNLAIAWEKHQELDKAIQAYHQSINLNEELQLIDVLARAWNNLGILYHNQNQKEKAQHSYQKALHFAQISQEMGLLGNTLANLAELNEDYESWKEAMNLLESNGYHKLAQQCLSSLPVNHSFIKKAS